MVPFQALLAPLLALCSMALPARQQAPPKTEATPVEPGWQMLSEEAQQRRLRALERQPLGRPGGTNRQDWSARRDIPTYRVQVIGHQNVVDFRSTLRESLAEPLAPATPGFLAGARGLAGRGPAIGPPGVSDDGLPLPLIAVRVRVNPARVVNAVRRWAYDREVNKTRREVAEELAAVIKANQTADPKK